MALYTSVPYWALPSVHSFTSVKLDKAGMCWDLLLCGQQCEKMLGYGVWCGLDTCQVNVNVGRVRSLERWDLFVKIGF